LGPLAKSIERSHADAWTKEVSNHANKTKLNQVFGEEIDMILRNRLISGIVAMCTTVALTTAAIADYKLYEAAKKEGQVVWYTTLIVKQAVRPIVAAFEKNIPASEFDIRGLIQPTPRLKSSAKAEPARLSATCLTAPSTWSH